MKDSDKVAVYSETGKKRTMAGALDWPGWCRGARDVDAALKALLEYGPRYERVLSSAGIPFQSPQDAASFEVVERLQGTLTTDFGVPDIAPSPDEEPVEGAELARLKEVLRACWSAFDATVQAAQGKELGKGPRGGGRDLVEITRHVLDGEVSYLLRLGGERPVREKGDSDGGYYSSQTVENERQAILDALDAAVRGEFVPVGPRGGRRWTPRYFVRRAAWHVLDHAWEIEDRVVGG